MGGEQVDEGKGGLGLGELLGALSSPTEKDSPSLDCKSIAWAPSLDPRVERPNQRLSLLQGDHHRAPCSCRARQAHQGPPGHQAPSAAPAWRFSSTSLTTCRVSARRLSGAVCVRVCACVCVCVHTRTPALQVCELPDTLLTAAHVLIHRLVLTPAEARTPTCSSTCTCTHTHTHTLSHWCALPRPHPCALCGGEGVISTHVGTRALSNGWLTGVLLVHSHGEPPGPAQSLPQFLHL